MSQVKVFLGGTCAGSDWRPYLIKHLKADFFNPVVENWTAEAQLNEEKEKDICSIHLYVITNEMKGVFSIAEVMDSVNMKTKITILHVIPTGFDDSQLKSLKAVVDLVRKNGGIAYVDTDLIRSARVINECIN